MENILFSTIRAKPLIASRLEYYKKRVRQQGDIKKGVKN